MNMTKMEINGPSNNLITWGGDDPFTHFLTIGPTRCGKTSTILEPMIYEIYKAKRKGEKVGLTIIEPKRDLARKAYELALDMGLGDDVVYIDPFYPQETKRINVMKGDKNDVTEATVAVLKSLFGKQDAFFATVQELSSRKVTLLLKELYGDNMDILDVLANLRDEKLLKQNVDAYRTRFGTNDLVSFFDHELLGTGSMADKYRQFIVGLRSQLENITSNEYLKAVVTGKSDIDLDEHLEKGKILIVNTEMGKLGKSGDAFGMFIMMHIQLATFRRKGTERTRVPHYLIVDEMSRYINPDLERFLSVAASFRVALIAAIQSLSQLEVESGLLNGKAMKNAILTSTRNKIIFGGLEYEDANEVSKMMGADRVVKRSRTFDGGIFKNILPKIYKDDEEEVIRFHPTLLMDGLPRFHCICKLLKDGTPQEPFVAKGEWIPRDWKEQMEMEKKSILSKSKPKFYKWKERAIYEVERFEYENAEKIKLEKQQQLLKEDPFESSKQQPVQSDEKEQQLNEKVINIAEQSVKTTSQDDDKGEIVFNLKSMKKSLELPNDPFECDVDNSKDEIEEAPKQVQNDKYDFETIHIQFPSEDMSNPQEEPEKLIIENEEELINQSQSMEKVIVEEINERLTIDEGNNVESSKESKVVEVKNTPENPTKGFWGNVRTKNNN